MHDIFVYKILVSHVVGKASIWMKLKLSKENNYSENIFKYTLNVWYLFAWTIFSFFLLQLLVNFITKRSWGTDDLKAIQLLKHSNFNSMSLHLLSERYTDMKHYWNGGGNWTWKRLLTLKLHIYRTLKACIQRYECLGFRPNIPCIAHRVAAKADTKVSSREILK